MRLDLTTNASLNLEPLRQLFGASKEQLFLVAPNAKFPFDEEEWRGYFRENPKNLSLLFHSEGKLIAHSALLEKADGNIWVCFVFVAEDFRGRGLAIEIMAKTEEMAKRTFGHRPLALAVRDYNPHAIRCYEARGFREVKRNGSQIIMVKEGKPSCGD